jgi:Cdc6-like AAA superfamily ATPase
MLGISNAIDAMAKYSKNICINLNEIKNIVFEPYSHETIVKIIK